MKHVTLENATPQPPRLLDQLRRCIRDNLYNLRTERAYVYWAKWHIRFHGLRNPKEMGGPEIQLFMSYLVNERKVAGATYTQALCAPFVSVQEGAQYRCSMDRRHQPTQKTARRPTVLTLQEIELVFSQMEGVYALIARLLYGMGMRLMECAQLRVKDVDFQRREIAIRQGKGGKDRLTMLPLALISPLREQIAQSKLAYEEDRLHQRTGVMLPNALELKYPTAGAQWGWFWVFPSDHESATDCLWPDCRPTSTGCSRPKAVAQGNLIESKMKGGDITGYSSLFHRYNVQAPSLIHQLFELLADHCTEKNGGRRTFLDKVNSILKVSTLDSSKDIDALWRQTWDKPLYADQYAYIASDLIDILRGMSTCPLDDFRCLPSKPDLLKGLKRYTLKHRRVLALGTAWHHIYERHIVTARAIEAGLAAHAQSHQLTEFARQSMGAPGYSSTNDEAGTFFDAVTGVHGFGKITALHISADLGYPVYKPDRWVVRFAATDPSVRSAIEQRLPRAVPFDQVTDSYLERHLGLVLFAIDHLTEAFRQSCQPQEIVDLGVRFRRHRFVDLMVVKFGMTPEKQFGLEISGKDALLSKPELAQHYPELHLIAQEMDHAIKVKMRERQKKRKKNGTADRAVSVTVASDQGPDHGVDQT